MSLMVAASLALLINTQEPELVGGKYSAVAGGIGTFAYPSWISKPVYTLESEGANNARIRLTFKGDPAMTGYKIIVQALFEIDDDAPLFDRNVTAVLRGTTYYSKPSLTVGEAGVVDQKSFAKLGAATAAWSGRDLTITYSKSLVANTDPIYVRVYCVPDTFDLTKSEGGLNGIFPSSVYQTEQAKNRSMEPWIPEAPKPPFELPPGGGEQSTNFNEETESVTDPVYHWQVPGPTPKIDRPKGAILPNKWPRGMGTGNGKGGKFWPVPPVPPSDWIGTDLNGSGGTDYILPGHDQLPYTDKMLGYVLIDGGGITQVVGKDNNGNGRIDKDEVVAVVGECIFPQGINRVNGKIDENGDFILVIDNYNEGPERPDHHPYNHVQFRYNLDTGNLEVWKFDPDGKKLKWQPTPPPGSWVVHPDQSEPGQPSYSGPAKDYPWKEGGKAFS